MSQRSEYWNAAVRLTRLAIAAEKKYQEKKAYFDEITQAYIGAETAGHRILDQEARAAADPRREKASKDAAWARDEANMYATLAMLMVEMMHESPSSGGI